MRLFERAARGVGICEVNRNGSIGALVLEVGLITRTNAPGRNTLPRNFATTLGLQFLQFFL